MVEPQAPTAPSGPVTAPANRWIKCLQCGAFIYFKRFEKNLRVCPECAYHFRLSARERIALLLDPGSFQERDHTLAPGDPLGFVDSKPYPERIAESRQKTGMREAAIWGTARSAAIRSSSARSTSPSSAAAWARWWGRRSPAPSSWGSRRRPLSSSAPPPAAPGCRRGSSRSCRWPRRRRAGAAGGGRRPLLLPPRRPHLRRRQRLVRHAGRSHHRRAAGARRLRRPAGDRADDPAAASRGLPDVRVPVGQGADRPRRAARRAARYLLPAAHLPPAAGARASARSRLHSGSRQGTRGHAGPFRLGDRAAGAPPGPAQPARAGRASLRRFHRAERRPHAARRPGDRRRAGPAGRAAGDGRRPPEGQRHARQRGAQLRHAPPRGVPQGAAADRLRGPAGTAAAHLHRHPRRLSRACRPRSATRARPSPATCSSCPACRCRS